MMKMNSYPWQHQWQQQMVTTTVTTHHHSSDVSSQWERKNGEWLQLGANVHCMLLLSPRYIFLFIFFIYWLTIVYKRLARYVQNRTKNHTNTRDNNLKWLQQQTNTETAAAHDEGGWHNEWKTTTTGLKMHCALIPRYFFFFSFSIYFTTTIIYR